MTITKEVLDKVVDRMLDIWSSADQWTKRFLATDRTGMEVEPTNEDATKWCAIGVNKAALYGLGLYSYEDEFEMFLNRYTQRYTFGAHNRVANFNDEECRSFEDMRLFVKCMKDVDPDDVLNNTNAYEGCLCPDCCPED